MGKLMFCEYCREEVPYIVKKIDKQSELKGNVTAWAAVDPKNVP